MDQQALDALLLGLEDEGWDSPTLSSSPVAPLRVCTPRKPLSQARAKSPKKQQPLASKSVNTPNKPAPFWPIVSKKQSTPVGDGKENPRPSRNAVNVKQEFDDLLDGMDFDDDFLPTQDVVPEVRNYSIRRVPQIDIWLQIPLSQRYLRCTVVDVSDITPGGLGKMYKVGQAQIVVVENLADPDFAQTLQVRLGDGEKLYDVRIGDDWIETPLEIGQSDVLLLVAELTLGFSGNVVNLVGGFSRHSTPSLTIDRLNGFLILHPDILVSSTKVADTPSCARKPILQELIRVVGGSSEPLVYGNMLHELLQACLTEGNFDEGWKEEKVEELLVKEMSTLWSIDVSVQKARMEMLDKSKEFSQFSDRFRGDSPEVRLPLCVLAPVLTSFRKPDAFIADPHTMNTGSARFAITKTLAVEEDIWSPKYGLKGKVDVSVMGRILEEDEQTVRGDGPEAVIPFEIKTGRTVTALEHRAQTMLYTLMMSDRYSQSRIAAMPYEADDPARRRGSRFWNSLLFVLKYGHSSHASTERDSRIDHRAK